MTKKFQSEVADVEHASRKNEQSSFQYVDAQNGIKELSLNSNETVEFLNSINKRLEEHRLKMERLKNLATSL